MNTTIKSFKDVYAFLEKHGEVSDWTGGIVYILSNHHYSFQHLEEISVKNNDRLQIVKGIYHCFDGRRIWSQEGIRFDGEFIGVYNSGGREGDDHQELFITNKEKFKEMVRFIESLREEEDFQIQEYDINDSPESLTSFYNYNISAMYDTDTLKNYNLEDIKVGDVIEAQVARISDEGMHYFLEDFPDTQTTAKVKVLDILHDGNRPLAVFRCMRLDYMRTPGYFGLSKEEKEKTTPFIPYDVESEDNKYDYVYVILDAKLNERNG